MKTLIPPLVELKNISKSYGRFDALQSVCLKIYPGEIHGLVGVNGSGKTTLLNILSGQGIIRETGGYRGELLFENKVKEFADPSQAIGVGIGMVHQEFALIPGLSVSENISLSKERIFPLSETFLGHDLACIDPGANKRNAGEILGLMGIDFDPGLMAGELSVSMRQFVELAREINRDGLKLLLLDEPTAVLGTDDALGLVSMVKKIAAKGVAVLYVSHRLEEVISCCDRITVLVNGKVVDCMKNNGNNKTPHHQNQSHQNQNHQNHNYPDSDNHPQNLVRHNQVQLLSRLMTGKKVKKTRRSARVSSTEKVISLSSFSVEKPGDRLESLDLDIFHGEILGITSLSGHGRTALGAGIMGLYPARGSMRLNNKTVHAFDPRQMIQKNIWMLPEDRRNQGLLMDHSIMENMTFAAVQTKSKFVKKTPFPFVSFPDQKKCREYAYECQRDLDIDCRSIFQKAVELSGGNQQKVCIANALSMVPDILFVNDPTRGIDVMAKEFILTQLIKAQAAHSMTLVVSSGELDELRRICDRIVVLYQGRMFDVLSPDQDEKDYLLACSGIRQTHNRNQAG